MMVPFSEGASSSLYPIFFLTLHLDFIIIF